MPKKSKFNPSDWNDRRAQERLESEMKERTVQIVERFLDALTSMQDSMDKSNLSFPIGVALLGLLSNRAMKDKGFSLEQTLVYNEQAIETFYKLEGTTAIAPPESPKDNINKVPQEAIDAIRKLDSSTDSSNPLKRYTEWSQAIIASWLIHSLNAKTPEEITTIVAPFTSTARRSNPSFDVDIFKANLCQILIGGDFKSSDTKNSTRYYAEALIIATLPL